MSKIWFAYYGVDVIGTTVAENAEEAREKLKRQALLVGGNDWFNPLDLINRLTYATMKPMKLGD